MHIPAINTPLHLYLLLVHQTLTASKNMHVKMQALGAICSQPFT